MFRLHINDKPAVLPTDFNFKYTIENPRLGTGAEFSLELALPLLGCQQNIAIFGNVHNKQNRLKVKSLTFTLQTRIFNISGDVIVTGATEEEVKVQLISGNSRFTNSWKTPNGEDRYIDELPLGECWRGALGGWWQNRYQPGYIDKSDNDFILWGLNQKYMEGCVHGSAKVTDAVAFPIYSTLDEKRANSHEWRISSDGTPRYYFKGFLGTIPDGKIAAQPYLKAVINKIIGALGANFVWDAYEPDDTWMENIFIAHARNTHYFADALPHWSVEEFFKQLRLALGLYFEQKDNDVYIRFIALRNMPIKELHDVIDTHTVEEGDSEDDFTNVSVEYDIDDPILKLPEEVWQRSVNETYATMAELEDRLSREPFKGQSRWLFRVGTPENGDVYALLSNTQLQYNLCPVDLLPPYVKNPTYDGRDKLTRRCDETLKMQPCRMELHDIKKYVEGRGQKEVVGELPILSTDETRIIDRSAYSVDIAINHTDEEQGQELDKSDIMYLAVNTGALFAMRNPMGNMYEEKDTLCPIGVQWIKGDGGYQRFPGFDTCPYWELDGKRGEPNNINTTTRQGDWEIDTAYIYEFDFLDNLRPEDINSIFIIKCKPYICKRIEYTIQKGGIAPLKKGFFYPCDRIR